jgi:hypothetical protein
MPVQAASHACSAPGSDRGPRVDGDLREGCIIAPPGRAAAEGGAQLQRHSTKQ